MKTIPGYFQEDQEQTNWCWAAIAVSVAAYFKRGTFTQCALVGRVVNRPNCCTLPGACNVMWSVGQALGHAGCLAEHRAQAVSVDTLRRQIDFGNPVIIRLDRNGLAHVSTVVGYGPEAGNACQLTIIDPWRGVERAPYGSVLSGAYRGAWTDTYFTA